jgi:hypothetical protein
MVQQGTARRLHHADPVAGPGIGRRCDDQVVFLSADIGRYLDVSQSARPERRGSVLGEVGVELGGPPERVLTTSWTPCPPAPRMSPILVAMCSVAGVTGTGALESHRPDFVSHPHLQ